MADVFLFAVRRITPDLASCDVHWALWAIVELFHCCWENLDAFLLFVFILGNEHAGIFCRCASSTEKNPPQHQKTVQAQKTEVETYSENATLAFLKWQCWYFASTLYKNHCVCFREESRGVCWGPPAAPAPQLVGSCRSSSSLPRKFLPVATLAPLLCFIWKN